MGLAWILSRVSFLSFPKMIPDHNRDTKRVSCRFLYLARYLMLRKANIK